MPCNRRERTFISRTVLVSGRNSVIHEQDYYELGVLPRGGLTNEVLVKCSNRNYHTDWVDITALGVLTSADNGLNINPAGNVRLGGDLLEDTIISGVNTYFFELVGCTAITIESDFALDIISSAISISAANNLYIQTPNIVTGGISTNGQVLTLIDAVSGEAEWQDAAGLVQARNGLNVDGGFVELGGTLIESTLVDGDSGAYSLFWLDMDRWTVQGDRISNNAISYWGGTSVTESIVFSEGTTRLSGETELQIETPLVNANALPPLLDVGHVLTLTDPNSGLCEWQVLPPSGANDWIVVFPLVDPYAAGANELVAVDDSIAAGLTAIVNLPAAGAPGITINVKKMNNVKPVDIVPNGLDTIDNAPLYQLMSQYESITLVSYTGGWLII